MAYHIHGWLLYHFEELKQQDKLQEGKKEMKIDGGKYQYEGLLAGNKAYGHGAAIDPRDGDQLDCTFINDEIHGLCK